MFHTLPTLRLFSLFNLNHSGGCRLAISWFKFSFSWCWALFHRYIGHLDIPAYDFFLCVEYLFYRNSFLLIGLSDACIENISFLLTLSAEHTMQYTYEVLLNYIPEIYIILLTNVVPINFIKKENRKNISFQSMVYLQFSWGLLLMNKSS